jgi:nicotinamidase-related amidase
MSANTALLLIDIQNDYFPGGKMELDGSVEAGFKARQLLTYFRGAQLPLVHIQHIAVGPGATFFLPYTDGARIHDAVLPLEQEKVFQKHFPNSFRETPLLRYLRDLEIHQVVIAGMMTHMCVEATTRAAFDYGFQCRVAQDACATRAVTYRGKTVPAASVQLAFLAGLQDSYAEVMTTSEILTQLKATPPPGLRPGVDFH